MYRGVVIGRRIAIRYTARAFLVPQLQQLSKEVDLDQYFIVRAPVPSQRASPPQPVFILA